MTLPSYAGYAVVPLHFVAGVLFSIIPASPYQQGYYATFGAIVVLLAATVITYGRLISALAPGFGAVWLQVSLAAVVVVALFFVIDFNDPWHAIVYPLVLGGSLVVCLGVGHAVLLIARPLQTRTKP